MIISRQAEESQEANMFDILLGGRRIIACIWSGLAAEGAHVLELVHGVDVLPDVALSDERDAVARRLRVKCMSTSNVALNSRAAEFKR